MKTNNNNKLDFKKQIIAELDDSQMYSVSGGSVLVSLAVSVLVISPALSTTLLK